MIWRPLYADPPPAGSMIVIRDKGFTRPEIVGTYDGSFVVTDAAGRPYVRSEGGTDGDFEPHTMPPKPEYLVVGAEHAPVLTPGKVSAWFATKTAALDNSNGQKLKDYGLGQLWRFMESDGVGPEGLELAVGRNRISEARWNTARGPGWILVQTDRHPVRCWFARKR